MADKLADKLNGYAGAVAVIVILGNALYAYGHQVGKESIALSCPLDENGNRPVSSTQYKGQWICTYVPNATYGRAVTSKKAKVTT